MRTRGGGGWGYGRGTGNCKIQKNLKVSQATHLQIIFQKLQLPLMRMLSKFVVVFLGNKQGLFKSKKVFFTSGFGLWTTKSTEPAEPV
jgi:hypothetical protein